MTLSTNATPIPRLNPWRCAVLEYGFRPFFLLCGVYALLIVPLWLFRFAHDSVPFGELPGMYWHAHEMLYGFVIAAVAGFLLTAVPSWTGARGFAGWPLLVAVAAWLLGRVAMSTAGSVPFWFLSALRSGDASLAGGATRAAIDFVLILVTVIGGRIVPAFTANALRKRGEAVEIVTRHWLEFAVIGAMIAIAIFDAVAPNSAASGILAVLAAALHALRLSGWRSFRTRGEPILWVMHVAYAWLPLGLALKACALLGGAGWAMKWQHALTSGVLATMILAVMTRASLGHTGRPLAVPRAIALAYVLLTAGTVLRVFGIALFPGHYLLSVSASGLAWVLSFGIFVVVYLPILWGPRADGKPG